MATRVYASFPSASQEAAFLGIDNYDAAERRLQVFQQQLSAAFFGDQDLGFQVYEAMQADDEVAELESFRLFGFGRVDGLAIPAGRDPSSGGVPLEHPTAPWLLGTAGGCHGIDEYGADAEDVIQRLKACGCTEIYWC
jgi:hypothetical protein